jgi:mRNA-degrading endonuclease toxin of MazEF toxin-antitoxin module
MGPQGRLSPRAVDSSDAIGSSPSVVPFSTTIRELAGEVVLDERDGLAVRSTLKIEWIRAVDRTSIGPRIATFPVHRWSEVKGTVVHVLGLDEE